MKNKTSQPFRDKTLKYQIENEKERKTKTKILDRFRIWRKMNGKCAEIRRICKTKKTKKLAHPGLDLAT
jgi:hypothetical protein